MTILIMVNLGQRSTILEKKWKITKNCQKSWFFRKICLLWHPNSPQFWRSIYEPAVSPLIAINWKKYKKYDFLAFFQKKSTRDVFYQGYTWFPNFFYVKMKLFKLWFLAQKVFKRVYFGRWGSKKYVLASNKNLQFFRFLDLEKFQKIFHFFGKIFKNLIIFLKKVAFFSSFFEPASKCY